MKTILVTLMLILMTGCSSLDTSKLTEGLENQVSCTVAKDKATFTSMWYLFGFTHKIREEDAKVICSK